MSYQNDSDLHGYTGQLTYEVFKDEWANGENDDLNLPVHMFSYDSEVEITFYQPRKKAAYTLTIVDGKSNYKAIRRWYLKTKRKVLFE